MLRDVVGTYLDTLTEREFDAPLLAILSARGFVDVHFIHGSFEFGKDVVAKRTDPQTGEVRQFVIQSKAGDIGLPEWRAVRPQLEECEYNTLGHPAFDAALPRTVVLVTTGRLKGGAPVDASEYRKSIGARGIAGFEIWDRSDLVDWICQDPNLGMSGSPLNVELMSVLTEVLAGEATERRLERYSRAWLPPAGGSAGSASIEAAVLVNALVRVRRLDLALTVALQLLRSVHSDSAASPAYVEASQRLILGLSVQLLDQIEPLLLDPLDLARHTVSQIGQVNYLVISCRVAEAFAVGWVIAREADDTALSDRFRAALLEMIKQPGSARPPSDLFATSVVVVTVVTSVLDESVAVDYLQRAARWLIERHDTERSGMGLAGLSENEATTAERLLGGALESTSMSPRSSSYLATALLDLAVFLELEDLYEALLRGMQVHRIIPETTSGDESRAFWMRGGANVWPIPRVDFEPWTTQASVSAIDPAVRPSMALLLTAACRSRHYRVAWAGLREGSG